MSNNSEIYKIVDDEEPMMTKEEISMFLYGSQNNQDILESE